MNQQLTSQSSSRLFAAGLAKAAAVPGTRPTDFSRFYLMITAIIKAYCFTSYLFVGFASAAEAFNYRAITDKDIAAVKLEWEKRDLAPKSVSVVVNEDETGFILVQHTVLGAKHYGAIITPKSGNLEDAPVMVILDGLNQEKPVMKLDSYPKSGFTNSEPYSKFIKIIPSFRGRTALYKGVRYSSEGDFCDAYDGATDDAIALVNAAQTLFPTANFKKLFVRGYSRGGLVALLMGVRDPRVNAISSFAAPTDFYRLSVNKDYGSQYHCQFLSGMSDTQARNRMLASSPVYFKPQDSLKHVDIQHGEKDEVVPVWHARNMAEHLDLFGINVKLSIYPLGKHNIFTDPSVTFEKTRAGLYLFMNGIKDTE